MTETTASRSSTSAGPGPGRAANITLWILQVLTAVAFVFAAVPKVTADPMAVTGFAAMGIGTVGMVVIGLLELAGAVAMFIPRLTGLAAICFIALLIGAITATLIFADPAMVGLPAVLLVVVAIIAYGRRHSTVELFGTLRRPAERS